MARTRHMALLICPVCNEPVELTTAKSDGHGSPVHEECYAAKLHRELMARPARPDGNPQQKGDDSWRTLAEQITREPDPKKMIELAEKLNDALVNKDDKQRGARHSDELKSCDSI